MSPNGPYFGIDFGAANSSIAWYHPDANQAEIILNAEGEAKTPSLVYFDEDEVLVGKLVEVVAEVLKKLKRDAEAENFQEEVECAVITCSVVFGSLQLLREW